MKTVDITLVGISSEFALDVAPIEISGALFAKTFSRDRTEMRSELLFFAEEPVTIAVGDTLPIGETVRVTLTIDSSEIEGTGENLGLGGQLSIGGPRHLIIPTFYINDAETGDFHQLRFASEGGHRVVRADFIVKLGNTFPI
jgi:hypothetical protein